MKIAVDCDEVIAGLLENFIMFHNDKYGTSLSRKDFFSYHLSDVVGETFEEENRKFSEFLNSNYFKTVQPIAGSLETLKDFKKRGFEMEIVTARPPKIIGQTLHWVKTNYDGIFSNVNFARNQRLMTGEKGKGEICLDIGADFMIEDGSDYALDVASRGISVLLYDAPWNKNCTPMENIKRVSSWNEIEKIILTSSQAQG